ncbi:CRTAC1 family protein [Cytobacillus praedii]|uniref:CRTAC1 family protein n=1 Tax=Cytobacillus praedii TaxID=1742358 RepID=UPI003F7FC8AE
MKKYILVLLILVSLTIANGCSFEKNNNNDFGFEFEDISKKSGVTFIHEKPKFDSKIENLMPWMISTGASVATADFDGDGFMDLYFTNSKEGSSNKLYKNNGDGTFTEVSKQAGVDNVNNDGVSTSVLFFDYDNDGFPDLFVGKWGKSNLFRNNGDGTFTDVTEASGVIHQGYVAKAITLDYDKDGYLDLYLGNYFRDEVDLWNLKTTKIMFEDFEKSRNGGKNVLYRNNGDGTFTDVSNELDVNDTGWTLATGSADINNDGWPDIYNANDFGPDVLYLNQEGKGFQKVVQKRGVGDDTFKGMNVDFADLYHDGNLAFYISNISKPGYLLEGNQLWHMDKDGKFIDRAKESGAFEAGWSWGARFLDVNNSGEFSLMVTNGFISASKEKDYWFDMGTLATTPGYVIEDTKNWPKFGEKSMSGYEKKFLFLNNGEKFTDVAQEVGITFDEDGRGIAAVDLLNEGILDLVFANQGGATKVYKNSLTSKDGGNWIKLNLIGSFPSNRDAVGSRVTFEIDGKKTIMERDGGNSFGGQSDPRIHFGLGENDKVDKITIVWPSGNVQVLEDVKANQILDIEEEK